MCNVQRERAVRLTVAVSEREVGHLQLQLVVHFSSSSSRSFLVLCLVFVVE